MQRSVAEGLPRVRFLVNSLHVGGAERHLVDLVCHGTRRGLFRAEVVCLKEPGALAEELVAAGIPVSAGWLRSRYDVNAVRRLVRHARKHPVDVTYTHHGLNELLLATICRTMLHIVNVCTVHATNDITRAARFGALQRRLLRRSTVVVGVAPSHRAYLVGHEGLVPARTITISNGVDHERFRPSRRPSSLGDARLSGRKVVGVVGSLTPEKGHDVLLQAFVRVVDAYPRTALVLIGDGERRAALEDQAARLEIADRVVFLGIRRDVDAILGGVDAFVLPALPARETFSIAVLEAMACGLPIVASRVGSMPDMIRDGCEGFLVRAGDAGDLAESLCRLMADESLARRMGAAARARVEAEFTLDAMVSSYGDLFQRLVAAA
jgi:glycosyltransferase involved in cell wall biosynthesis